MHLLICIYTCACIGLTITQGPPLPFVLGLTNVPPSLSDSRACCEQQAAYDAPRSTHISRYIRRWIPVPLITADLFRRVILSPDMQPRGRGFDSRSVTFPPPGFGSAPPPFFVRSSRSGTASRCRRIYIGR